MRSTMRTQRVSRFSEGRTRRNGPSCAESGWPSMRSAIKARLSVKAGSSSGTFGVDSIGTGSVQP